MQSAMTFLRHGLSDTLAMSPRLTSSEPHRSSQSDRSRPTSHSHTAPADYQFRTYLRGQPKTLGFLAAARFAEALRCKTRRHWLCRWRPHPPRDVAAVSRGFSRPHRFSDLNLLRIRAVSSRLA